MKVLFLDVDGVLNNPSTPVPSDNGLAIDPFMAFLVGRLVEDTGCKIVLSSSWRFIPFIRMTLERRVCTIYDVTSLSRESHLSRGEEIALWLKEHLDVESYAILDDENDMLEEQQPNFFKCLGTVGLTSEIARRVEEHLMKKGEIQHNELYYTADPHLEIRYIPVSGLWLIVLSFLIGIDTGLLLYIAFSTYKWMQLVSW